MNLTTETLTGMDWTYRDVNTHESRALIYQYFVDYDKNTAYGRNWNHNMAWFIMDFDKGRGDTVDSMADTHSEALQAAYDSIKK